MVRKLSLKYTNVYYIIIHYTNVGGKRREEISLRILNNKIVVNYIGLHIVIKH